MTALDPSEVPSDNAFLATVATALLIRLGGRTVIDDREWEQAVRHEGTLYLHRDGEHMEVLIVLLPPQTVA